MVMVWEGCECEAVLLLSCWRQCWRPVQQTVLELGSLEECPSATCRVAISELKSQLFNKGSLLYSHLILFSSLQGDVQGTRNLLFAIQIIQYFSVRQKVSKRKRDHWKLEYFEYLSTSVTSLNFILKFILKFTETWMEATQMQTVSTIYVLTALRAFFPHSKIIFWSR